MLMDSLELSQQLPTPSHPPSDADQCGGGSTGTLREASKIISNPAKTARRPLQKTPLILFRTDTSYASPA
jgi:hypothetical protein